MKICTLGHVPNISHCCIALNYLAGKKSGKYCNELQYELSTIVWWVTLIGRAGTIGFCMKWWRKLFLWSGISPVHTLSTIPWSGTHCLWYEMPCRYLSKCSYLLRPRTESLKKSLSYNGAQLWNSLPPELRVASLLSAFKSKLRDVSFLH